MTLAGDDLGRPLVHARNGVESRNFIREECQYLIDSGADRLNGLLAAVLVLGLILAPLASHAQRRQKRPTIGFFGGPTASAWSSWVAAFVQRLRELGWTERRTVAIEYRWAEGRSEPVPSLSD
jgi:hypothetical protein